jgi:hypothetical protein
MSRRPHHGARVVRGSQKPRPRNGSKSHNRGQAARTPKSDARPTPTGDRHDEARDWLGQTGRLKTPRARNLGLRRRSLRPVSTPTGTLSAPRCIPVRRSRRGPGGLPRWRPSHAGHINRNASRPAGHNEAKRQIGLLNTEDPQDVSGGLPCGLVYRTSSGISPYSSRLKQINVKNLEYLLLVLRSMQRTCHKYYNTPRTFE